MNFQDDTDSTEKILNLIRKDKDSDDKDSDDKDDNFLKLNSKNHVQKKSFSLMKFFLKKKHTLGFDFRKDSVRIVKLDLTSEQKHKLLLCKTIPFNQNLTDNEEQLANLNSVIKHEYNASNVSIWAAIPKGKTEIRFFRIPKSPKKQLLKSIFWTFKKLTSIEEHKYIFDFEILGEVKENDSIKKEIIAYAVLKKDIAKIKAIFSKIGFPLTGISIYPFALQNLIKYQYINTSNENICCLFIGMEWSRIDIFFPNGNLAFSQRIRACTNSMIDEIAKNITQLKSSMGFTETSLNITEKNGETVISDQARKIFFSLIYNKQDLESNIKEILSDINSIDIFEMFAPALKRLVWRVERSINSFQANAEENHIGKIYVSGEIVEYKPIIDFIGRNLEHQIEARDFEPFACNILDTDDSALPESSAEKSGYFPAFGIALSKNFFTPNFILTYKEKSMFLKSKRVNYFFFISFILILILTLSGFWGQRYLIKKKEVEFAELQKNSNKIILKNNIHIDNNIIDKQISKILEKRKSAKLYVTRNFKIAVLKEITNSSLPNMRLLSVSLNSDKKSKNETKESETKIIADIQGVIQGNPLLFETSLTRYMEVLKNKAFTLNVAIKSKENKKISKEPVLQFNIYMEIKNDD